MESITNSKKAYFIGGGLASLAGAAYLIKDCNYKGNNIYILENLNEIGGSNDGSGNLTEGFSCRGGRMLTREAYENFWDLLSFIPSLENSQKTVKEEITEFNKIHKTHAKARLIDKNGKIINSKKMGFNFKNRLDLLKLMLEPEEKIEGLKISDWFDLNPNFFETNFWYMWQTTFAFQKWSSLVEFQRYMKRMILEFSRIDTLGGIVRTPYNQYVSVILPLKTHLSNHGVNFNLGCTVTDLDFKKNNEITVTNIYYKNEENNNFNIELNDNDLCFMTNGCMTDNSTLGNFNTPPLLNFKRPPSEILWSNIKKKKRELGNPKVFFGNPEESNWESFTVTMNGNKLLKKIENFSGNTPGTGGLMTFKDSNWLMSIVVAAQPHFKGQTDEQTIFWGYGLYTKENGNYIKKPMRECTGKEILSELLHHLNFENEEDEIMDTVINVIPCMMPYIISMFQPRALTDRPDLIPYGSTNFAMISQFVEIPEDMVFTEEYSVRAARTAVYHLTNTKKEVCPVTPQYKNISVLAKAVIKSFV